PLVLPLGPPTVVVAGDDAGPPARQLAEAAGWPLFAEPSAGCRTGSNALRSYRLLLDGELGDEIQRVVVAGHPTLSRPVTRLLARADVSVVSLRAQGCAPTRPFAVSLEADALVAEGVEGPEWLSRWQEADRLLSKRIDAEVDAAEQLTPYAVARAVSRALPAGGLLVVGASNPIRDLDLMAAPYVVGERRKVIANRGLAGIDGTLSTAIGAALGRAEGDRKLALVGDVTFLHDASALVLGPREARPDLTIVVVNDDGGSIFAVLEQGAETYADRYDLLFGTPHHVDLAALCAATRTPHWRVTSLPELEHALANPAGGIEVIEATVRRDDRREWDIRLRSLAGPIVFSI
ncbi:MAG: thiamine pyrophosphate-dependent enzyme, partial [Nocardioides sp.]